MSAPPKRAVIRREFVDAMMRSGRSSRLLVSLLDCGHVIWRRCAREPQQAPRPVACVMCCTEGIGSSPPGAPLEAWTDVELAGALSRRLWQWFDAGGMSEGRSYDAAMFEAIRDLLRLPLPAAYEQVRPGDSQLLAEVSRRRWLRAKASLI